MPQLVSVPTEDESMHDLIDQINGAMILMQAVQAAAKIVTQVSQSGSQSGLWANHAYNSVSVTMINLQTLLDDIGRTQK